MKSESAVKARAATAEKPTAELPDGKTLVRLRNILVATDFSAISETALNHAVSLARLYDAQLYVAHVIEPVTYAAYPTGLSMPTEQIHRSVDQQMTDLLISGRLRGVPNQVLVGEGEL